MKPLLVLSLLCCFAALALEQTTVDYGHVAITADRQERSGAVVRRRGQVEIATGNTLLRADEADFHSDTGEIELRGNVRVKLLAAMPKNSTESPRRDQMEQRLRKPLSLPEIWK
jgi:lipopolysaccharide assembly outer membrane protein LptD (OstA)